MASENQHEIIYKQYPELYRNTYINQYLQTETREAGAKSWEKWK